MKNIKIKILSLLISTLLIMNGCISPPENFIAPSFDATYAFPITDTLFTLNDFIEDDSSFVVSDDPEKLGVLIYSTEEIIDPFYISEQLKISAFSTSSVSSIGTIKIDEVPPLRTNIAISDWTPISGGNDVVFPEASAPITSSFELINEFESALFKSGSMEITIQNNLPVTTEFREFKIINSKDGSIVVEAPINSPIVTLPLESTTVSFDLSNVTITNSLKVATTIYTPGSGTDTVTVSNNAGTEIEIGLSNLIFESVTGIIPEQDPIIISDSFIIDDSTKVEAIIFDEGSFRILMNNYFDLDLNINFEIKNLFDSYNNNYNNIFSLKRNERNKIIEIPSLKEWQIKTLTPGTPTNLLEYSLSVLIAPTDGINTIRSNDSVTVNIDFSESYFAYAEGLIKPTKFEITKSDLNFDLGDFQNSFNFDSIFISTPSMVLDLSSSVNFDIILNGLITGTSDNLTKTLEIQLNLPALVDSKFDLNEFGFTEFVNSFTTIGEIPEQFSLSGSGIVNPNYNVGSISKTDSVAGGFSFEVPLDFGISGGSFQDTISLFDSDFDEATIESINSIELTIESLNKIPVNIIMKGTVLDILNNPILDFPPSYSPNTYISLEAPIVDENGNVTSAEINKQVIQLNREDAITFMQNRNIEFIFSLDTPPINSVAPVKFRNTDNIYFKVYGKINYRMNGN
ncbi:MAG: hypothetical protein L3J41_15905 [Melioribacteraceae bacterium]|nr:hypothetical protein [Melioribacteraceae bacterium]